MFHDERVVFIIEGRIPWQGALKPGPQAFICLLAAYETKPREESASIGINDKDGTPKCVENNVISSLRTHAVDTEERRPQRPRLHPVQCLQPPSIDNPLAQSPKPALLHVIVTCRTQRIRQNVHRQSHYSPRLQYHHPPQPIEGPFDIGPRGILGQDRSHHDLKRGIGRPPMPRPVMSKKIAVDRDEIAGLHRVFCGADKPAAA